ncbi:MAG: Txe/YoeB family addiction module toxin [Thermoanaerobaculia bacterium]
MKRSGWSSVSSRRHPVAAARNRNCVLQDEVREDLRYWIANDRRVALKVIDLIDAVMADPFGGIGKPEPLRHLGPDMWSRRLTQEHRVVYLVRHGRIDFLQARYHY